MALSQLKSMARNRAAVAKCNVHAGQASLKRLATCFPVLQIACPDLAVPITYPGFVPEPDPLTTEATTTRTLGPHVSVCSSEPAEHDPYEGDGCDTQQSKDFPTKSSHTAPEFFDTLHRAAVASIAMASSSSSSPASAPTPHDLKALPKALPPGVSLQKVSGILGKAQAKQVRKRPAAASHASAPDLCSEPADRPPPRLPVGPPRGPLGPPLTPPLPPPRPPP